MKHILKTIVVWIITIESRMILWKYGPRIVAVTGSVGKTSTKDAIYTALSQAFYVRKSDRSYNSEIGVPLTIIGRQSAWGSVAGWLKIMRAGLALIALKSHYPKWLVIEVGIDRPGDMERVTKWLPVDIAVFTNLGTTPVHVSYFESSEELKREKLILADAVTEGGVIIRNADDPAQASIVPRSGIRAISYGIDAEADVRGSDMEYAYDARDGRTATGMRFTVNARGEQQVIELMGVVGRQHVYPSLAAIACGIAMDIPLARMAKGFARHLSAPGRMRVIRGARGVTIIDDSYNSSPAAARSALDVLEEFTGRGRRIAAFGEMAELGKYADDAHRALGARTARVVDSLVVVGKHAALIAAGARDAGLPEEKISTFDEAREAGAYLARLTGPGDAVLIKGSQVSRMERVTLALLERPDKARELLVRQEKEWERR